MARERIYEDLSLILRRSNIVLWLIAGLFVFILGCYWKIQIIDVRKYKDLAEANRTRTRILSAPRGLILDRNGKIIGDNAASYKVSLIRENMEDFEASCRDISRLLQIDLRELKVRIDRYKGMSPFNPVVIKDNLDSRTEVAKIESRRKEFPELTVESEPKRFYPHGSFAAHVLGYLQERTPDEIAGISGQSYRPGDMGGKAGIEKTCDGILTGRDGQMIEIVDSLGKSYGPIRTEPPQQGQDVFLTIDIALQEKAEKILAGREGAVVVMDPRNGEILAMASFPTFDPNGFISRFTPDEWLSLIKDPAAPLENRAMRGLYAPGSIFKLVMGLAALEFGYATNRTTFFCSGSADFYGTPRSCWYAPGHGSMNLADAIKNSCNIYFYNIGRLMGIDKISEAAKDNLKLGMKTGIDIDGEKEGLVPNTQWKRETTGEPWYPGETISVAIGQGQLQTTPLQLARLTATIANRGGLVKPHLVLRTGEQRGADSVVEPQSLDEAGRVPFETSSFESIIEGMWRSVNAAGTGSGAFVPGMDICGKTGSTQVISTALAKRLAEAGKEIKTHSWFSGFGPRGAPEIVITVLVEYGGGGGATAAPLARELFEMFWDKND